MIFLCVSLFSVATNSVAQISKKNQCVIDTVTKYGHEISSTYDKAVCTELVIKVIEKIYPLNKTDKSRIRIITKENIYDLLKKIQWNCILYFLQQMDMEFKHF